MPALDGLCRRLEDAFELQERHAAPEQKLGLVTRTAQTLLETLNTRHSLQVVWYVVIPIEVEIFLKLYELFLRGHWPGRRVPAVEQARLEGLVPAAYRRGHRKADQRAVVCMAGSQAAAPAA